jgi:hypothetical protein
MLPFEKDKNGMVLIHNRITGEEKLVYPVDAREIILKANVEDPKKILFNIYALGPAPNKSEGN